jgi:plastocyanin
MNIKNLMNSFVEKITGKNTESALSAEDQLESAADDEVGRGTKVKVIAALLVAGFASYVAWWVQEPATLRTDVLGATEQTMQTESGAADVTIVDFAYSPLDIAVDVGTTVIWTNQDAVQHTVTGENFSSGTLNSGDTFSHTFETVGTFEYTCSFHPQMKGRVIVGTVVGATEQTVASEEFTEEVAPLAIPSTDSGSMETSETQTSGILDAGNTGDDEVLAQTDAQALAQQMALEAALHAASVESAGTTSTTATNEATLPESGPADFIYAGILLVILFLNRGKLFPKQA